jgi:hypothetical protein
MTLLKCSIHRSPARSPFHRIRSIVRLSGGARLMTARTGLRQRRVGTTVLRTGSSALAKIAGGWQINGFPTLQSGAPFRVLNGGDPGGVVTGNLVGTSIRPHLNTTLDLSRMTVREIQAAGGGSVFRAATVQEPIGNLGRNVLRANGINRLDFGIIKNTRISEATACRFTQTSSTQRIRGTGAFPMQCSRRHRS